MHKKIFRNGLMLIVTLMITIGMQSVTFGLTSPILDSLKTYKLVNTYVISNTKSGDSGSLLNTKATIILGTDLNSPYMINPSAYKSSGATITKDANGVYILTKTINSIPPNSSHSINVERTFTTGTIDYNIDKSKVTSNYSKLTNYTNYLKADSGIEVNDARIQAKAKSLTGNIVNPYDKAFAIFKFVNTSMTYNLNSPYANKGALSALTYKQGVCEDYAKLFVALCRASGIPSRTVVGYRNSGLPVINNNINLTNVSHMWAEVYMPSYGWVISEPTVIFNQKGIPDNIFMKYFGKSLNPAEHIAIGYKAGSYDSSVTVSSKYEKITNSKPIIDITSKTMLYTNGVTISPIVTEAEQQKINEATRLTLTASNLQTRDNYNKALIAVNKLQSGVNKTTLETKLVAILKTIEGNEAGSKFPTLLDSPFLTTKDTAKVWNIKLNQAIDKKTATIDNISVKNSKGELIGFNVSCNGDVVSISPIDKYQIGEQYAVYISDKVLSIDGSGIKDGYYFTFEIK